MAQPEYVPTGPRDRQRPSERLPTPASWFPRRPAEVVQLGGQPSGRRFGIAGPDQGYALKLARHLEGKVVLAPREHLDDVSAGCIAAALRRAAVFGRAPVLPDLELAYGVWGYLDEAPPALVTYRTGLFRGCNHDLEMVLDIANRMPEETLRMKPADARAGIAGDGWRRLLGATTAA